MTYTASQRAIPWALRHFTPRQIARALKAANAIEWTYGEWVPAKGTVMNENGVCRGNEGAPHRTAWQQHVSEQSQDSHPILKLPKRA